MNHPFFDGNKRIGHGAMETFLALNGLEIDGSVDEQDPLTTGAKFFLINRDTIDGRPYLGFPTYLAIPLHIIISILILFPFHFHNYALTKEIAIKR
jgi:hypothetical protein